MLKSFHLSHTHTHTHTHTQGGAVKLVIFNNSCAIHSNFTFTHKGAPLGPTYKKRSYYSHSYAIHTKLILKLKPNVRTHMLNMDIQEALNKSKIVLKDSKSIEDLEKLLHDNKCFTHPIWINYATRLDESQLFYFLPDQYKALVLLTGFEPPYLQASTENNAIQIYLVGKAQRQPFAPFWNETCERYFMKHSQSMTDTDIAIFLFAREIQRHLNEALKNDKCLFKRRLNNWTKLNTSIYHYFVMHRRCVIQTAKLFDVDMMDHDLNKTRLIQIAFGRVYHWTDLKSLEEDPWDNPLDNLGRKAIFYGHLKDHHPKWATVDPIKLFVDHLSVHMQKDPEDAVGGWDLNETWFAPEWKTFKNKHKHLNLYELSWYPVSKAPLALPDYITLRCDCDNHTSSSEQGL